MDKADAIAFTELKNKVEHHIQTRQDRDGVVDERLGSLHSRVEHIDECTDELKVKVDRLHEAMLFFRDPKKWIMQNWWPLLIVTLLVTMLSGSASQVVWKGLAKIFGGL